ncbi:hypothetical protein STASHLEY_00720 [Brevundimonas phage vB_BpoS-StAshley]|nr:hypothetical protein STASHLEY_00720 [Brevundimonas phage vB_BpoS-StAshley]UTC30063.1 hypothetical protein MAINES_00240 [Brevundimonas phage vB_BpoS-MaInes]
MAEEESQAERQKRLTREAELNQARAMYIADAMSVQAKKKPGEAQRLYYARSGQYGKDKNVLLTDGSEGFWWVDPSPPNAPRLKDLRLAIGKSKAEIVAMCLQAGVDASYCIFERVYTPIFQIVENEVLTIYQKEPKRGR